MSPGLLLAALVAALAGAEPAPDISLDKVVASLIRDLGAERYDIRERATDALRRIGPAALAAVEQAAKSDDPEVSLRARDILADLRLGIGPDWPSEVVLLIRHYGRLQEHERSNALQRISSAVGAKSAPFLIRCLEAGGPNEANYAFYSLQRMNDPEVWEQVIRLIKEPKNEYQTRALTWARAQSGQSGESLEDLADALVKDTPQNKALEEALEGILKKLKDGKSQEVADAADKLAKEHPGDTRALYLQAEALVALDKDKQAIALRERALTLFPDKEVPHHLAAELLARLGRNRLAVKEWQRILEIDPGDSPYDLNAYLNLSTVHAANGLFEPATQYLEKAVTRLIKAKDAGSMPIPAGSIEGLQTELSRLRQRASSYPTPTDAAIDDSSPESEVKPAVEVTLKEGKIEDLRRALAATAAQFPLTVQPPDMRVFDLSAASLKYDKEKKQLLVLFHDTPACKPLPFEPKTKDPLVAFHIADCTYIFKVDVDGGKADKVARFEKDYAVALKPDTRLATYSNVTLRINGKPMDWEKAKQGLPYDVLPPQIDVAIEGTTPLARRAFIRVKLDLPQPKLQPLPAEAPPKPKT